MESVTLPANSVWGFATAGRISFGRGAISGLGPFAKKSGWRSGLLVTDRTLMELGFGNQVVAELKSQGVEVTVFDRVEPEPAIDVIDQAVATWRTSSRPESHSVRSSHPPKLDFVIGLGGGSCLDTAKMTAVLLTHNGTCQDYFGFDRIPGPICPLVAIPSTAGTGSEVSHSAVLTDRIAGIKVSTLSSFLRPHLAIVDPQLTDSCPARVTAESGIDALVHAIEAYTARDFSQMSGVGAEARAYEGAHPLGKILALEAIRLIDSHLETVVVSPNCRQSRDAMALAATYAGMAFSNCGVALVHGLEYPLGALMHCSHGAGNGLLLPYVMQFNAAVAKDSFAEIAIALGSSESDTEHRTNWLIDRVIELRKRIGIPLRLRDLGVPREALPMLAEKTSQIERLMTLNPRQATTADLNAILESAF